MKSQQEALDLQALRYRVAISNYMRCWVMLCGHPQSLSGRPNGRAKEKSDEATKILGPLAAAAAASLISVMASNAAAVKNRKTSQRQSP